MVNRTQTLVLAFFPVVLVSVMAIRAAAPDVYDEASGCHPATVGWRLCSWPRSLWFSCCSPSR
jgi:hypothetical protein